MLDRSPSTEGYGKFRYLVLMAVFAFATLAMGTLPTYAATFVVNTTADTQDATPGNGQCADAGGACSLRAAITEANALAGADIITLPAGTYTHSLTAATEDANAGGDMDITGPLTINGAGAATTIVQANAAPDTAAERVAFTILQPPLTAEAGFFRKARQRTSR
jgi:CSLREA domain-containing protein